MMKKALKNIKPMTASIMLIMLFSMMNSISLLVQDADKFIRSGNKYYADSNFQAAELKYTKALETDPNSEKGLFNQGNSYYQQEKYEEALQNYEMTAELMLNPKEKAAAYHNLGNAYFKGQQLEKSIEAYKNALRLQPNDAETKYNLALAKKLLEQQKQDQQNQDKNQDQQENKDQENKDQENKDQENQDQNQQDQQKDGEGDQDKQDQGQEDQQEQKDGQQGKEGEDGKEEGEEKQMIMPSKLSKEEVERILEALANDEIKVQEKLIEKKTPPNTKKSDKDW